MGFLSKIFGGGGNGGEKKETSADKMLKIIREKTTTDYVRLVPVEEKTMPWNSKIGGLPYMPLDFEYPHDETVLTATPEAAAGNPVQQPVAALDVLLAGSGQPSVENPEVVTGNGGQPDAPEAGEETGAREKKPLRFLGQLNFAEMPALEGFPREGILQFYISGDDAYGLNFENRADQRGFRVIYHERVTEDVSALLAALPEQKESDSFPVSGERKLTFEKDSMPMTLWDFRFEKLLLQIYNQTHPDATVPNLDRVDESVLDDVYAHSELEGHRVGGYPSFMQLDPREYDQNFQEHTVLLFQLDSDDEDGIMWGDSGVCNFFIRPGDLAKRDFSGVLYNWDCY